MHITIVVHGRFHAFDLARELAGFGHEVRVLTALPPSRYLPFGLTRDQVDTYWYYAIVTRLARYLPGKWQEGLERWTKPLFSRWAARKIMNREQLPDVIYCFSGVAEELFTRLQGKGVLRLLARGSTHIRYQYELLHTEEQRTGQVLEKPSAWIIDREEREYRIADRVVVLSTFSLDSFHRQDFDNVSLMLSGCQTGHFKADENHVYDRIDRIRRGAPLRILTVGSFSYRKGAYDLVEVARQLENEAFEFRFVGDINPETRSLSQENADIIEFIPRVPHFELTRHYQWADIFFFPTIEDGYPAVLGQAHSMGLPILASRNSSAPDLVKEGMDGKLLSAGDTKSYIDQLREWNENREALAEIARAGLQRPNVRDWHAVARRFEEIVMERRGR